MYVAMKDLEIRGAGNILGARAVRPRRRRRLRPVRPDGRRGRPGAEARAAAQPRPPRPRSSCRSTRTCRTSTCRGSGCGWTPTAASPAITSEDEIAAVRDELTDRFGPLPVPVLNLLEVARVPGAGAQGGLAEVTVQGNLVRFAPVRAARLDAGQARSGCTRRASSSARRTRCWCRRRRPRRSAAGRCATRNCSRGRRTWWRRCSRRPRRPPPHGRVQARFPGSIGRGVRRVRPGRPGADLPDPDQRWDSSVFGKSVKAAVAAAAAAGVLTGRGAAPKAGTAASSVTTASPSPSSSETVRDWREQFRTDPVANEMRANPSNPAQQLGGDSESDLRGALDPADQLRGGRGGRRRGGRGDHRGAGRRGAGRTWTGGAEPARSRSRPGCPASGPATWRAWSPRRSR